MWTICVTMFSIVLIEESGSNLKRKIYDEICFWEYHIRGDWSTDLRVFGTVHFDSYILCIVLYCNVWNDHRMESRRVSRQDQCFISHLSGWNWTLVKLRKLHWRASVTCMLALFICDRYCYYLSDALGSDFVILQWDCFLKI